MLSPENKASILKGSRKILAMLIVLAAGLWLDTHKGLTEVSAMFLASILATFVAGNGFEYYHAKRKEQDDVSSAVDSARHDEVASNIQNVQMAADTMGQKVDDMHGAIAMNFATVQKSLEDFAQTLKTQAAVPAPTENPEVLANIKAAGPVLEAIVKSQQNVLDHIASLSRRLQDTNEGVLFVAKQVSGAR